MWGIEERKKKKTECVIHAVFQPYPQKTPSTFLQEEECCEESSRDHVQCFWDDTRGSGQTLFIGLKKMGHLS